jgi:hypothetical protein
MSCTHSKNCELYVRFAADPSIEVWKKHFCNGDFKKCERYEMSLKGMSVPLDLLPNGKKIATDSGSVDVGLNTLFNAIQKNRLPMVNAIVRVKSVNEGMPNEAGVTPTMLAASLGRKEMVELFLDKGCNPHTKCNKGKTALDYAEENGQGECAEIIKTYMQKVDAPVKEEPQAETTEAHSDSLLGRLFGLFRGSSHKAA